MTEPPLDIPVFPYHIDYWTQHRFQGPKRFPRRGSRTERIERALIKRALDLTVALAALLLSAPVLLVIAILIRANIGRPVFFRQPRAGLDGAPFTIVKFRTMNDGRDAEGKLLPDEDRLVALGFWIRRFSLDELPQLWNVIRADMSLVGPRPLLLEYVPFYTQDEARRLRALPGITGWAQVNGRDAITWEQKFALDRWYVERQSLFLDLRILRMTVAKVIRGRGISPAGRATMEDFRDYARRTRRSEVEEEAPHASHTV